MRRLYSVSDAPVGQPHRWIPFNRVPDAERYSRAKYSNQRLDIFARE